MIRAQQADTQEAGRYVRTYGRVKDGWNGMKRERDRENKTN